jgi:protein gp37
MATAISWTDETWNPTSGCSHVSEGCRFCYAERISLKFGWSKKPWTAPNAEENVVLHPERLRKPYSWKTPSRVFVNSMSDLFHPQIPDSFIADVFKVMVDTPQHTYQILTKRPERAAEWGGPWPKNIWQGTSVEDAKAMPRIDHLRRCGAQTRFLSCEPLLGPLDGINLDGIHWVIVGGESGFHMQPQSPRWMKMAWARSIRDACVDQGTAYFFKQDAGMKTELRPWLVEEDGSKWKWHQYPGIFTPPERILIAA